MKKLVLACFILATVFSVNAQIKSPQPSPAAKFTQTVGLTEVTVEYSRPAMKGRTIFGDLVPFDALYRTGANSNTTISFSDDIIFGGTPVKKGKYSLYSKPGEQKWDVMLYSTTDNWGLPENFNQENVVATATAEVKTLRNAQESFTIGVNEITMDGAHLQISWDRTLVEVPFKVPTNEKTLASIKSVMAGPSANDYYNAASFYLESDQDLKQAYEWIKMANVKQTDAFWMLRRQSLIEAALGDKKAAIASAKKSLELAQKANNNDYVKLNQDSLKEWGAK